MRASASLVASASTKRRPSAVVVVCHRRSSSTLRIVHEPSTACRGRESLRQRHRGEVGVRAWDRRHDRRVGDEEPVEPVDGAAAVDDAADRARADRVEETARRASYVRHRVDLWTRARLPPGIAPTASPAASRRSDSTPSARTVASAGSERNPWSILSGARGSLECRRTEPRDAGFIAKTATLTS